MHQAIAVTDHEEKWVLLDLSKKMVDPIGTCGETSDDQLVSCASREWLMRE